MREYLPLLIAGAVIGVFTVFFLVAYGILKCKVSPPMSGICPTAI